MIAPEGYIIQALLKLRPPRASAVRWSVIVALLIIVGAAHHLAGRNVGLYTFFVVPCALAAWSVGLAAGFLAAASSALIALASDLMLKVNVPPGDLAVNAVLRFGLYAFVSWSMDAIGRLLEHLDELSRSDPLTGLANRREFMHRGAEEVQRARRSSRAFSVLFLDLDNFKSVNDGFGHAAGDALLKHVAVALKAQLRSTDFPARVGGDEFAVILPETDSAGAGRAATGLHDKLRGEFAALHYSVSASIGAATFARAPASFADAVEQADTLMYSVKNGSKDAVLQRDFP